MKIGQPLKHAASGLIIASLLLGLFHPLLHNHALDLCCHDDCLVCQIIYHTAGDLPPIIILTLFLIGLFTIQDSRPLISGMGTPRVLVARAPPDSAARFRSV
ncbi:hypothetical protein JXA80_14385 [bacterium]|nr:hypothetical protein [candidate division CSSED10-310 bacterium]